MNMIHVHIHNISICTVHYSTLVHCTIYYVCTCMYMYMVRVGHLLKIDPSSSIQDFLAAVKEGDGGQCAGRLVSLAAKAGSMYDVSTQLLASHVHTKLEQLSAGAGGKAAAVAFVYRCIVKMPLGICAVLGKEVRW